MDSSNYQTPVSQLLTYGHPKTPSDWANYSQEFGLKSEHIPELIRLATDLSFNDLNHEESPEVWAPLHAWRALSEFGPEASSAVTPLLGLITELEDDDYFRNDMPKVMAKIGPPAITELEKLLHGSSTELLTQGLLSSDCLEAIAKEHPETRERIFDIAIRQLDNYRHNDRSLNGLLILLLCDLENADALPAIEKAFFEGKVDVFVVDWEDVQIAFGINDPAPNRESLREFMKIQLTARQKPKGFGPSTNIKAKANKSKKKSKS
ncbi:MAG: hypothetical protein ACKO4S_13175 [Snowella sp.]